MLTNEFYLRDDVVRIARELIGKVLYTGIDGQVTAGIISETEAYHQDDKACHAYNGRFTERTSMLYEAGGRAYVYLCYGIHHLFNIVTGPEGIAQAVLIRGVVPLKGIDRMIERRNLSAMRPNLSAGPGTLSQALGITTELNGTGLFGPDIWLADEGCRVRPEQIRSGPRIGVDYAGEDALLPWRFLLDSRTVNELQTA